MAKNEAQHARNVAVAKSSAATEPSSTTPAHRSKTGAGVATSTNTSALATGKAAARNQRKAELDRTLLISKVSTASMGKFDKKIEGEPKAKGVKRKFEPTVGDVKGETSAALDILKRVERGETSKTKKGGEGQDGGVNYRKAVRNEGREQRRSGGGPPGGRGGRGGGRGGKR